MHWAPHRTRRVQAHPKARREDDDLADGAWLRLSLCIVVHSDRGHVPVCSGKPWTADCRSSWLSQGAWPISSARVSYSCYPEAADFVRNTLAAHKWTGRSIWLMPSCSSRAATNGLRVDEQAPPRRSVVSAHMRGNVFVSTPARPASCWRVGAWKKGGWRVGVSRVFDTQ